MKNKTLLLFIGIVGFITINLSVVSTTPSVQLSFKDIVLKALANQETKPKKICSLGARITLNPADTCLMCDNCDEAREGVICLGDTDYCD